MFGNPLHRLRHVTEAADATWIADFARASAGRDVVPHTFNGMRPAGLLDLCADGSFVFVEAVADHSFFGGLFLPDRNSNVSRAERVPVRVEVDDIAVGARAKPIGTLLEPSKRLLG